MKRLFYVGLVLLTLFEILKVYFIMPMPGSQQWHTVDIAYFLHTYRWCFRIACLLMILAGGVHALKTKKIWIPAIALTPALLAAYLFNFKMTADHMFLQPLTVAFSSQADAALPDSALVIAVVHNYEAKAYPLRYIQYHHQVRDTIAGKAIMVTYCNVCRTGRVFEPLVNGKVETFRLVGMDHFNAMFEDETTESWWRQATGEAIAGPLKGEILPEVASTQYTLAKFFTLHPSGKVMQPDQSSMAYYDSLGRFEKGKSRSELTRTDTSSWKDKSWVIGVQVGRFAKGYDWNVLKKERVIHDKIGSTPLVVALASDNQSFIVFERNDLERFVMQNDSLVSTSNKFDFAARGTHGASAKIIKSYQEFWHSWKQFHPETERYK